MTTGASAAPQQPSGLPLPAGGGRPPPHGLRHGGADARLLTGSAEACGEAEAVQAHRLRLRCPLRLLKPRRSAIAGRLLGWPETNARMRASVSLRSSCAPHAPTPPQLRVDRQLDQEVRPGLVGREQLAGGAVLAHRRPEGRGHVAPPASCSTLVITGLSSSSTPRTYSSASSRMSSGGSR